MKTVIHTPKAPAAIGPYSQAIAVGDMIYTSSMIPIIPENGEAGNREPDCVVE